MSEIYAVAISPDKHYLVLQQGNSFALINRKEGITQETEWKGRKLLSQMLIKGNYLRFKKHIRYKGI